MEAETTGASGKREAVEPDSKSVRGLENEQREARRSDDSVLFETDDFESKVDAVIRMDEGGGDDKSRAVLEAKPPNYMWLALCTTIFFNPLFGIAALVTAMHSDSEYLKNNRLMAKRLGQAAKYISLLGMGTTIAVVIIISVQLGMPELE